MLGLLFAGCASAPTTDAGATADDDANAAIAASVPSTDIVLVSLPAALSGVDPGKAVDVAVARGYDNQPAWAPDGRSLMYTRIADGQQADAYRFDVNTGRTIRVTTTTQSEYSPTPLVDGQWTCIHVDDDGTQRLARYNRQGRFESFVRADVTGVGYHRWLSNDQLAVFVVADPPQLELLNPSGSARTTVASNIGRSLNRTAAGHLAFVAPGDDGTARLHEYNPVSGVITTYAALPSASVDLVWLADDSALVADGRTLYRWQRNADQWQPLVNLARSIHGDITRMAADPSGVWLALVVGEPEP